MDYILLLSLGVFAVAAIDFITNYRQWLSIKRVNVHIQDIAQKVQDAIAKWTENGSVGEQLGDWLLSSEKEGEPSNIDVISNMVGLSMAKGMRNAYAGEKSGDVRMQKGIDGKVFEAIQDANPEMKLIGTALDRLGLGDLNTPELMPYAAKALGKYIPKDLIGGQVQQNDGGKSGW